MLNEFHLGKGEFDCRVVEIEKRRDQISPGNWYEDAAIFVSLYSTRVGRLILDFGSL